jgi:PAS domain S-box-containing protein
VAIHGVRADERARSEGRVRAEGRARPEGRPIPLAESILDRSDLAGADVEAALQALLECGAEVSQTGSWDWRLDTNQLRWSDNLYRLFGLEPGEIAPSMEYVIERAHPADRELVRHQTEASTRDFQRRPFEYRIVRPDGGVRHLRSSNTVIQEAHGRPRRIVGSIQDITDTHRAERTIAAHLAVAEALADWRTLEQGATKLLRNLGVAIDCVAGVMWLPEGDVLVAHVTWRSDSADVAELESVIRQLRLPRGVGLAGQVWERGEPRNVLSLHDDPRFPAEAVAGLRGAVAVPAVHAGEVLAVLEFCCEPVSVDVTAPLLRSLTGIGYELGEFLAHRRGELKPLALTPRELQVLQLAAQGCGGREIAERLVLSPATVRTHFGRIYDKYGVSDRAAAVAKALRDGLID